VNKWNVGLGDVARFKHAPFEGVVIGRAEYLYGCKQVLVKPSALKDSQPVDAVWFDEGSVDVIKREVFSAPEPSSVRAGGPGRGELPPTR